MSSWFEEKDVRDFWQRREQLHQKKLRVSAEKERVGWAIIFPIGNAPLLSPNVKKSRRIL
jgi:hypothetical protein